MLYHRDKVPTAIKGSFVMPLSLTQRQACDGYFPHLGGTSVYVSNN